MKNYSYKSISKFGPNEYSDVNNPLTYCIGNNMDQRFIHGSMAPVNGNNSTQCQLFMSDYCAVGWDGFCELESKNTSTSFPVQPPGGVIDNSLCMGKAGDLLIANTAARKYLIKMHNATEKYQPFDPTVPNSPMIRYWVSNSGSEIPEYAVDPKKIDDDVLMDKILEDPNIALHILINIYNTMKRHGTLSELKRTKLGIFYNNHPYFKQKGGV